MSACFLPIRLAPFWLLWCAIALLAPTARAQYRFDSWTTDSGLPQNTVRSILQTRDGYLWFATLDGVVRYDGVRFKAFDKANTRGIESNRFFALVEDREGALWMATEDGGVTRCKDGAFTAYTSREGLPHNTIRSLQPGADGHPVAYTPAGAARWDGEKFVDYSPTISDLSAGFVYHDPSGAVWHQTSDGLHYFKDGKSMVVLLPPDTPVTAMLEDRQGIIWIGGGKLLSLNNGALVTHPLRLASPGSLVTAIFEDSRGNLWIGTNNAGLIRLSEGKFTFYTTAQGLSDNYVMSIYEDREGTLWVGTANRGINRINRQIISVYSMKDGLTADNVYPIYEDRSGNIWIGARGLNRLSEGKLKTYVQKDGLRFFDVMSLAEDREGRLWIGAVGGLSFLKDGSFTDFTPRLPLPSGNYNVWAIHEDRNGALWIGTDRGLVRYANDTITLYTTKDGLADNDVKCIYEDRGGVLWIGTYGGLSYLKDGRFRSLTESDGLASNRVRTIHEDADGTFWIGTYDGGLARLKDGRFTSYTTADGLFSNGAFQILDDLKGNFWIGSNRGIYRVSREQLDLFAEGKIKSVTSVSYGKEDGLLNTECNGGRQPSGVRSRDGRLWIPTQGGVAVIDVASLTANPRPPPVVIEEVILNRERVSFNGEVLIAPGKESLEIRYTGLSFIKPENVRFRYRMEGIDSDWFEAANRRAAYYPYLPPGSYTFVVVAANSDGVWSQEERRLQITVMPPFWRTWWFTLLAGAALAAIAFIVYGLRVAALKRANRAQEFFSRQLIDSQERERKRIAAELHDSLGQNLLVIKNWAMLGLSFLKEGDRGRDELQEISASASQAISEVREISYNLRPHLLDEVGLTEALQSMVKRVASASEIQFEIDIDPIDDLFSNEAEISIYRIVQEAVNNIVRHSGATRAEVTVRRDLTDVLIQIRDNGRGIAPALATGEGRKGFGMVGMSERARMLGGKLTAHSVPGQGTMIEVKLGVEREDDDE